MGTRLGIATTIATAAVLLGAASAQAAVRVVDPTSGKPCKKGTGGPFATIQAAVDAAGRNDTIVICQGDYEENVRITTDGLKLQGQYVHAEVVTPAAAKPVIHIDGADNVQVTKLVIAGPFPSPAARRQAAKGKAKARASATAFDAFGILVDGGARNARIVNNRVEDIDDGGGGIDPYVFRSFAGLRASAAAVGDEAGSGIVFGGDASGSGIASDNRVEGYTTAGIVVRGPGSVVNLSRNSVAGDGGVFGQSGILVQDRAQVTALANNVSRNSLGYILDQAHAGSRVNSNIATNNLTGFDLERSSGVTVKGNSSSAGAIGFYVAATSTGNTLQSNTSKKATEFDCADDSSGSKTAGTGNTWTKNKGAIAAPDPICN